MAVFDVLFTTVVLAVLIAEGKIRWRLREFVHQYKLRSTDDAEEWSLRVFLSI